MVRIYKYKYKQFKNYYVLKLYLENRQQFMQITDQTIINYVIQKNFSLQNINDGMLGYLTGEMPVFEEVVDKNTISTVPATVATGERKEVKRFSIENVYDFGECLFMSQLSSWKMQTPISEVMYNYILMGERTKIFRSYQFLFEKEALVEVFHKNLY